VVAAHKSVAILGVIGRADDMHAILDAETEATMAFLERWFARQGGRRGRAQRRTRTGGLLWATTRHATSRAGDPAPHDHVLIANLTEMLDDRGGWKALDTGGLRNLVHAATMAGRLASAAAAVELGYAITPDHGPSGKLDHWALAGIPLEVTELFSKRAAEVDEAIAAGTFTSYRARGIAARDTRDAKGDEVPEALLMRWWDELAALGWAPRPLDARLRIVNRREAGPLRGLTGPERQALVAELIGPGGPLSRPGTATTCGDQDRPAPRRGGGPPGGRPLGRGPHRAAASEPATRGDRASK
jgi:conjugative relaxase-like TrwC/TraI family protein